MKALIVAHGDVPERGQLDAAWPGWDDDVGMVVVADGGARSAADLGLRPDVLVGDADSIDPAELARLEAHGTRLRLLPRAKDASDTELALHEAVTAGAASLTVLGALGGLRFDHALANVLLLGLGELSGVDLTILDGSSRLRLLRDRTSGSGELGLAGRVGDLVSLFPLEETRGVVTEGLEYSLNGESLPLGTTRGLSNVRVSPEAGVSLQEGRLLVVETTAPPPRPLPDGGAP